VANCKLHGFDPASYFVDVALRRHREDPASLTPAAIAAAEAAA
jgi:hypothetical protein